MEPDERIIKSYLGGRKDLLEVLIKRYIDHVYNFIFRFVRERGQAEDLTQETFIKVWKNLHKFEPEKKFKTWLFQIARNTAIDFLRKKKSINFSELNEDENEDFDPADSVPTPDEVFEKKETRAAVKKILDELPPKYGSILTLYYQSQLNFREIAELTGESVDTVKSRHRRAISLLKKKLIRG